MHGTHYDDGGYSGSNINRPGLQKLLQDVNQGRIDCVVVYKVDRLSRSLLDFAKLIDQFDRSSVSFVSVTQQFNTTNSLGRLTLNILLSFAQFEREIIGERTRDKMSAARRRGKWIGGTPMLGYDLKPGGGGLIINQEEAARVREIYSMFLQHESLDRVVEELRKLGWTTKAWTSKSGRNHPGRAFQPKSLKRMLTNPLYAGRIEYRREIYQGEHQAIIEAKVWEEASRRLTAESRGPNRTQRLHLEAILTGLLYCEQCHTPMLPTYTNKGPRRYRYYVCRKTRTEGWHSCLIRSVSAPVVENAVLEQLYSRGSATESAPVNADHAQLIRSKVARIGYDGVEGTATLEMKE